MGTIAPMNSQNGSGRAMPRISGQTFFANSAARVYVTDNAFADPFGRGSRFFDNSDKFVPDGSRKPGVAAHDFKVGIANSRFYNPNQGFRFRNRSGNFGKL